MTDASQRLLIENCDIIATMDEENTEIHGGSIVVEDGAITQVSPDPPTGYEAADRIDGRGAVAIPGLVNTHHHLFQTLTRARAQEQDIFGWLQALYPIWEHLDADWVHAAALAGLAELILSGCTLSTDHHYAFPQGKSGLLEAEISAAETLGIRFQPNRGSMDLGTHNGGLPPGTLCQEPDEILTDTEAAIRRFHDPAPGAMLQISVGPCYPLTNSGKLMTASAELARRYGVRLHTHLAEGRQEERQMLAEFGYRSVDLLEELGFLGDDVWLAHCVHLSDADIVKLAATSTGVSTCPSSNLRLGSGVAAVPAMLREGVRVGLGVDGSASNDVANMTTEARQLMLVHRHKGFDEALSARAALQVATRGGASLLGRPELGVLAPGFRGDIALFSLDTLEMVGTDADPIAGLLHCAPRRAKDVVIEGRHVVADGHLVNADENDIIAAARAVAKHVPK